MNKQQRDYIWDLYKNNRGLKTKLMGVCRLSEEEFDKFIEECKREDLNTLYVEWENKAQELERSDNAKESTTKANIYTLRACAKELEDLLK